MKSALAATTTMAALMATSALAGVVTSQAGTEVNFPTMNYFCSTNPACSVALNSNITWSSTNISNHGGSVFGFTKGYSFVSNGFTTGTPMVGLNDSSADYGVVDTMTFTFATPTTGVGGYINWVDAKIPPGLGPVTMTAWDGSTPLLTVVLEDNGVSNPNGIAGLTPGGFIGIEAPSAEITKVTFTDGYVGMIGGIFVNLPEGSLSVPEPETWTLMLSGVAGLGAVLRTRRRRVAPA